MNTTRLIVATLLLFPVLAQAAPRINIGSLNDFLEPSKTTQVKRIYNAGTSTAFVKVSAWELVRGADGQYREVALDGQDSASRALVVSPARLIIPASGMQSVRLLYRGERDRERYFRLRFNPVLPEASDGFQISDASANEYKESLSVGVQILAGFGSLLYVRPNNSQFNVDVKESAGLITVNNTGNSTVVLDRFRVCQGLSVNCQPPVVHHLLPGDTREFVKAADLSVSFDLIKGADSTQHRF